MLQEDRCLTGDRREEKCGKKTDGVAGQVAEPGKEEQPRQTVGAVYIAQLW